MGNVPPAADQYFNFTLQDLQGQKHALSDYKGKIVFLNFWASWCPPCRAEMPSMQKMYQVWDKDKYVLLAVNIKEGKRTVKKFARDNGYTFPILLDSDGLVAAAYGVRGIPATFIIDAKGKLVRKVEGAREWTIESLEQLVQ